MQSETATGGQKYSCSATTMQRYEEAQQMYAMRGLWWLAAGECDATEGSEEGSNVEARCGGFGKRRADTNGVMAKTRREAQRCDSNGGMRKAICSEIEDVDTRPGREGGRDSLAGAGRAQRCRMQRTGRNGRALSSIGRSLSSGEEN